MLMKMFMRTKNKIFHPLHFGSTSDTIWISHPTANAANAANAANPACFSDFSEAVTP
jgi:hypothetical protein